MNRELIGYVGVDSGQVMITDPCYIKDFEDDDAFPEDDKQIEFEEGNLYSYSGACAATMGMTGGQLVYKLGHAGAGVAVNAGFGDGLYPVYVEYVDAGEWGQRVKSVTVEFIGDDEV